MTIEEEILTELKEINSKLNKPLHPIKNLWRSFLSGMFSSLGYIFGTAIVASLIIYLFSKSSFGQNIKSWIQSYQPSSSYQISAPSPDQP